MASVRWVRQLVVMRRTSQWHPATDAYETPDRFTVIVELPGMRSGDFSVNLTDQRLIIVGKRERPSEDAPTAYHQLEVQYGEFRVEVLIPFLVEREQITAVYEDGFLRVDLPRRRSQSHAIQVIRAED
ncbi:MAG: Hsp20/alpha crystallin family protein [Anaerolineae bacterium]|nr:Hsp20/alpha crystallin family protein [Anaerolineae bacterium]